MIVRCNHCQKMMPENGFDTHECDLPLKECRSIEVVYFQDVSYKNKKLMNGWGTDGVLYTFAVVPRKAISLIELLSKRKVTDQDGEIGANGEVPVPCLADCLGLGECDFVAWFCLDFFCSITLVQGNFEVAVASYEC